MGFIIVLIILVLAWYFGFYKKKQTKSSSNSTTKGANSDELIAEAIEVVNDYLNIGKVASIFTDTTEFRGHVACIPDARPPFTGRKINYGFAIMLFNVDDLRIGAAKYPKMLENNPDFAEQYYAFMKKYQNCYEAQKKAYIYQTNNTAAVIKGQQAQLEKLVNNRIAAVCPLADFEGSILYTKNISR